MASLIQILMLGSLVGLLGMKHLFWFFKDWKFKNMCLGMVCGKLKGAHHCQILIALQFKKYQWNITTLESLPEE
jgi:hypothetical protein